MEANDSIKGLSGCLDEKSKQIVWYVLTKGHAGIRELAELINASHDMDVLMRIRDIINPTARRILGKPLLKFENSRIDPVTGKKILFSWWPEDVFLIERGDEMLDILDEGDHLKVIMMLPDAKEIEVDIKGDKLIISAKRGEEGYYKEIPLFCAIKSDDIGKMYRNGVLEIRLNKCGEYG